MTRPIAGFMVSIALDGTIQSKGPVSEALFSDNLLEQLQTEEQMITKVNAQIDAPPPDKSTSDGKLIVAEEIEEGHVSWQARMSVTLQRDHKLKANSKTLLSGPRW